MADVLFAPEAGSPKLHAHPVIAPVGMVERSVKGVHAPKQTGVELKLAVGKGFTTTVFVVVSLHPKLLVTIKVAV